MKLSIIVPVYNVAQYLRHCLESLSQQELQDYEVILVNDASYDNSLGICIEWCAEHPEFRIISHPKNMGLSEARNTGMREASGEYITFVDSDDFLQAGSLAKVLTFADKADVVEYPVMVDYLDKSAYEFHPHSGITSFTEWIAGDGYTHCYACNKIYRASLWEGMQFPPGRYFEDILTIPQVLRRAKNIYGTCEGMYYYCKRKGSISNSKNIKSLRDYVLALNQLLALPECSHHTSLYIRALNAQLTYLKAGGEGKIIPKHNIPLSYLFASGITTNQRLKALWFKLTYHG